jgi:hypothetical protein
LAAIDACNIPKASYFNLTLSLADEECSEVVFLSVHLLGKPMCCHVPCCAEVGYVQMLLMNDLAKNKIKDYWSFKRKPVVLPQAIQQMSP